MSQTLTCLPPRHGCSKALDSLTVIVFVLAIVCFPSLSCLNADAFAVTVEPKLTDKTMVVWAAPANLTQRGGSALTLEDSAARFDAIVFGEIAPARWMAGSDAYRRTDRQQSEYLPEPSNAARFVQIAIVYSGNTVTMYRDGQVYASHAIEEPQAFGDDSFVVIGPRHVAKQEMFAGRIQDARIYAAALSKEQLQELKPDQPGTEAPWAWWTFEDGTATEQAGRFPEVTLTPGASIEGGTLRLDGSGGLFASRTAASNQRLVALQNNPPWTVPPSPEMSLNST